MPKKSSKKTESVENLKQELDKLQEKLAHIEPKEPLKQPGNLTTFEVRTLYSWKAPERLFIPRNRKWYIYLFLLLLIIGLILLFLQQLILFAAVAALGFVTYVMASVPPHDIEHKLTTEGIDTYGKSYLWTELYDFWVTKREGHTTIQIDTYLNYPRRLILLVGDADFEKIKEIMIQYIPFRDIPKETWMDKAANLFSERFQRLTK